MVRRYIRSLFFAGCLFALSYAVCYNPANETEVSR